MRWLETNDTTCLLGILGQALGAESAQTEVGSPKLDLNQLVPQVPSTGVTQIADI